MKYNIEGNIDFYSELYKSLEEDLNDADSDNICLITNEALVDNYVKLECGHTFNYLPLYYDIYNHKKKFNSMETSYGHLKINEIRCPYCRNKQSGVLPYYEELQLEKVNGVNIICENKPNKNHECYEQCGYFTENPKFIPELPESSNNCKFFKCFNYGSKILLTSSFFNDKFYCYFHKKEIISKFKKEVKDKEKKLKEEMKLNKKKEKNIAKEHAKKMKKLEKLDKKKSKQTHSLSKILELTDKIEDENVVLQNGSGCCEKLKSGANKGNNCDQKIFEEGLCKRHYQTKHNKNKKELEKTIQEIKTVYKESEEKEEKEEKAEELKTEIEELSK